LNLFAHMTLCDHAATPGGRLYVTGGGMRLRAPTSQLWALALEVRVPWSDNNRKFPFRIDLFDTDGEPFMVDTPNGPQALHAGGERRLTAGPGLKPGSDISAVVAAVLPPVALPPGQQFEWKLTLDSETRDEWRVAFATAEAPPQQQQNVA
jgi:hypothetical protein